MNLTAKVISEIRGGLPAREVDSLMEKAIEASRVTGKKSVVTITLTLAPKGRDNREMHISLKSALKAPVAPDLQEPGIYYVGGRGELLRNDPEEQRTIFEERADGSSPGEQRRVG